MLYFITSRIRRHLFFHLQNKSVIACHCLKEVCSHAHSIMPNTARKWDVCSILTSIHHIFWILSNLSVVTLNRSQVMLVRYLLQLWSQATWKNGCNWLRFQKKKKKNATSMKGYPHRWTEATVKLCLFGLRGIRRGVQRTAEAAGEKRDAGCHQDLESGIHRAAETRFPVGGVDHGPVQPSKHHPTGRRGHQEWVIGVPATSPNFALFGFRVASPRIAPARFRTCVTMQITATSHLPVVLCRCLGIWS